MAVGYYPDFYSSASSELTELVRNKIGKKVWYKYLRLPEREIVDNSCRTFHLEALLALRAMLLQSMGHFLSMLSKSTQLLSNGT